MVLSKKFGIAYSSSWLRTLSLICCLVLCFLKPAYSQESSPAERNELSQQLTKRVVLNEVFNEGFFGFRLIEAERGNTLFDFQGDKFFTPASNVKLLTWFVVESLLGDSLTAFYHQTVRDTFYLRGSGYPLLLHPDLDSADVAASFLKRVEEPIVLTEPSALERYGSGWSWDDYNDGYVYERSWLPVYGNRLTMRRRSEQADLEVVPGLMSQAITLRAEEETNGSLTKLEGENRFFLAKRALQTKREFKLQRPLNVSPELTARLLASGLGIDVSTSERLPDDLQWIAYRIPRPDTLLKHMLLTSDNFLAEQLLLSAASTWDVNSQPAALRTYVRDSLLSELSLSPRQWVDGSGLSRYNQLSPRQLTQLLRRIYLLVGPDQMKAHLPAGGVSGTLKTYFSSGKAPFVWAKTGSLRNVLALSGMIETKSGKLLLFSFLHNNFPGKSRAHYQAMEEVLTYIRDSY